jgi:integrase
LRSATRAENLRIHLGELERYLGTGFLLQRIDANTVNGYHEHLMAEIDKKKKSPRYVYEHWASFRQLIRWLYDNEFIEKQPRNLNSQDNDFPKATTRIRTISKEVYRLLVSEATDTTKLYLLLCLNCGMTQSDIAALRHDEVDWETGRITRKRTKTKDKTNVPTVSYPLWPCTFELLKEWRSEHAELVLVNRNGEPLKFEVIDDDDRHKKNDNIHNAFKRLIDRLTKQEKLDKRDRPTLKLIRKTGATALGSHPTYLALTSHYLGHAPVSMAEKYYANPPQRLVDEAINWLGTEFEVMGPEET